MPRGISAKATQNLRFKASEGHIGLAGRDYFEKQDCGPNVYWSEARKAFAVAV